MLLRLILENFLSFDTAQEFNMFPNLKRKTAAQRVYSGKRVPLLKQAAIYGNNAAGKSNLIKGVEFLRRFAVEDTFLSEERIARSAFRLREQSTQRPIELLIEFEVEERYYIYDVALAVEGVVREDLYLSGLGEAPTLLYHRSLDVVELGDTLLATQRGQWQHTKGIVREMLREQHRYASLLSLLTKFPVLVHDDLSRAHRWFAERVKIIGMHSSLANLIKILHSHADMLAFANTIFEQLSIGVDGVQVQSTDVDEWVRQHASHPSREAVQNFQDEAGFTAYLNSDRPILTTMIENGQKKVQELLFKQLSQEGAFHLDVQDQSDGTMRILTLLPAIYVAMQEESVVLIDEINHCIHPQLLFDLVRFFTDASTKGQLIFSTHETELMEQNRLLNADEIWLVEKKLGRSVLYSLNEFKLHHTISIRRAYRDGRFGGSYQGELQSYHPYA